jgi:protein-S-isoprenylcysteine O-methyltransferase Ste14
VIDLASAFHPGGVPLFGRPLVRLLGLADRLSIVKLKTIFAPELLTPAERRFTKIRNRFLRTKWEEQTVLERKERKVQKDPKGRELREFRVSGDWKGSRRLSMSVKDTLRYKLTKITTKTVLAGVVAVALFLLAKDRQLAAAWFLPGVAVTLLGEWLRLWAAGHLRKNKQLTTTGPYAYVKNPLYIGTLLITLGFSAMAMEKWIMVAGFVWFFIYYAPYKKKQESEKLVASFGDAWKAFDRAVPDYLPRLTPYPGRGTGRWNWDVVRENSEHETAAAVLLGVGVMLYLFLR